MKVIEVVINHVCPHCERVFDSPSVCVESGVETVPTPMLRPIVRPSLDELPGTCDWGDCDREATAWRASDDHGWLPVCGAHQEEEMDQ